MPKEVYPLLLSNNTFVLSSFFLKISFVLYSATLPWHSDSVYIRKMTRFDIRYTQASNSIFVDATTKYTGFFLHNDFALKRKYPSKEITIPGLSSHSFIILCVSTARNVVWSIGFEPTIFFLKRGRCPCYPDSIWEIGSDETSQYLIALSTA